MQIYDAIRVGRKPARTDAETGAKGLQRNAARRSAARTPDGTRTAGRFRLPINAGR